MKRRQDISINSGNSLYIRKDNISRTYRNLMLCRDCSSELYGKYRIINTKTNTIIPHIFNDYVEVSEYLFNNYKSDEQLDEEIEMKMEDK